MQSSSRPPIWARDLRKVYRVHEREEGLRATLRSLVQRQFRDVVAVEGISFEIGEGEVVGFLGPNGAGKTTTLKMLAGLLFPTGGEAQVLAHVPWAREAAFLAGITLVMGNRSQLLWDIPAADSLRVLQEIYALPEAVYRARLHELVELLELEPLLSKPVRNLSLGERMKVEFAAALIHGPRVLFLDEPTIGLDVSMQARIRRFVADYNRRTGATILLTSHYMDDVVALCKRVIVIHEGRLLYDGGLADLAERMAPYKLIRLSLPPEAADMRLEPYGEVVEREEQRITLRVPRELAAERTADLVRDLRGCLLDLTLEDPPIEDVIDRVFSGGERLASERPALLSW
jgi:viologen exporter family transport system ATP-binding protein